MHARSSPRKAMPAPSGGHTAGFVAAVVANVALAFGPMFVRLTDTGPVAAAFWRLALAAPALAGDLLIDLSLRSPGLLSLPVVGDIVVERLGDRIDAPAGSDTTLVTVEIASGSDCRAAWTSFPSAMTRSIASSSVSLST